jgi:hypothetical protein
MCFVRPVKCFYYTVLRYMIKSCCLISESFGSPLEKEARLNVIGCTDAPGLQRVLMSSVCYEKIQ